MISTPLLFCCKCWKFILSYGMCRHAHTHIHTYTLHFLYLVISSWTYRLIGCACYCQPSCNEHVARYLFHILTLFLWDILLGMWWLSHVVVFWGIPILSYISLYPHQWSIRTSFLYKLGSFSSFSVSFFFNS